MSAMTLLVLATILVYIQNSHVESLIKINRTLKETIIQDKANVINQLYSLVTCLEHSSSTKEDIMTCLKSTQEIQICCEQIGKMKHALGIENAKKYHRHGKKYIKCYRNYYQTGLNDHKWEELYRYGFATKRIVEEKYVYYYVSDKGIEYMNKHLQAIIKETN
jgi:hypothetical protein